MRNIKLTVEYDGTNYSGWQVQRLKVKTVQGEIEKTLQKILREKIKIIGSGRTDSGVHSLGQSANFKTNSNIPLRNLQKALNSLLPKDIAIRKIENVPLDFHSRFAAKAKTYRYLILNRKSRDPFLRNYAYFYPYPLDVKLMHKESRILLGRHNFKAFQASGGKKRDPIRTIRKIKVYKKGGLIYIDTEGGGFLYNMVRNIVGTLIEIGRGKSPPGSLKKILFSGERKLAGPTASAAGLWLVKVSY